MLKTMPAVDCVPSGLLRQPGVKVKLLLKNSISLYLEQDTNSAEILLT